MAEGWDVFLSKNMNEKKIKKYPNTERKEYLSKLTPEQREQERIMEELYRERKQDFYQSLREFKTKWYKKG